MSNLTYQEESWEEVEEELLTLTSSHKEEVGIYNDKLLLNIFLEVYRKTSEEGLLRVLTARDGDALVGYYVSIESKHPHYSSDIFSINDVFFIHKDYRKGFAGIKLLKKAEEAARSRGVSVITLSFKTYAPLDSILERLGWDYTERVYTKFLKEA